MAFNINYEEEVLKILKTLDDSEKKQVLDYLRVISKPQGESGKKLIEDIRKLNFDKESLREMQEAIDEACEVIEDFRDINLDG
jgi:mRNA-degrading endonuclease RelE of RelBE toxin-antitoxin system